MNKTIKLAIIIISISFLINLSISLTNHISGDGCWHMSAAKFIAKNNKLPSFEYIGRTEPFWPPPLFHITNGISYKVDSFLGLNSFFIRFTLPLVSLFCLIFLFLIAKKLYNPNIALYSIIFLAFIPIFIDYSSNYYIGVFLTCFILGSIYFILNDKVALAGLFFGLALLSKFNAPFAVFGLFYLIYFKYRFNLKKYIIFIATSAIGILSFLRNYLLFGNPVWPSLRSLFGGIVVPGMAEIDFPEISILNIFKIKTIATHFLSIFGIPGGRLENLAFLKLPFVNLLLLGFIILGVIYLIPIIFVFNKNLIKKNKSHKKEIFLLIWILGFLLFDRLYNYADIRLLFPIIPAIAIFWAIGFTSLIKKIKVKNKHIIISIILILICSVFVTVAVTKSRIASKEWDRYNEDYSWIKKDTPEDVLFYYNGQCLAINTDRNSRFLPLNKEDYEEIKTGYFFFNTDFNIEHQVILDEEEQKFIQNATNCTIIYNNPKTKTKICRI